MTVEWLRHLRDAGFSQEQAEAIAQMPEERYVTREYLDARLDALEHRIIDTLTVRLLGVAGLVIRPGRPARQVRAALTLRLQCLPLAKNVAIASRGTRMARPTRRMPSS